MPRTLERAWSAQLGSIWDRMERHPRLLHDMQGVKSMLCLKRVEIRLSRVSVPDSSFTGDACSSSEQSSRYRVGYLT
jgi:hypothetical protein